MKKTLELSLVAALSIGAMAQSANAVPTPPSPPSTRGMPPQTAGKVLIDAPLVFAPDGNYGYSLGSTQFVHAPPGTSAFLELSNGGAFTLKFISNPTAFTPVDVTTRKSTALSNGATPPSHLTFYKATKSVNGAQEAGVSFNLMATGQSYSIPSDAPANRVIVAL